MANRSASTESTTEINFDVSPFWSDKPDLWFHYIEKLFAGYDITTDQTKYDFVLTHMGSQYARYVCDIIWNPPEKDQYDTLKTELIRRFNPYKTERIQRNLKGEEIGNRTLSQFLRHTRTLAGEAVPGDVGEPSASYDRAFGQVNRDCGSYSEELTASHQCIQDHGERRAASAAEAVSRELSTIFTDVMKKIRDN
ncbi:hypothetical protein WN51_05555 [Melipona quadrifasciata]|uniref:DUF7041 domain-containing protein n=1 Tax=Melipona quadrifasciata TaxID=166423 RepID=A0A0N0BCR7_9HYME|nr:hypothetical protein WN51_05555 [Melipona quadrifasciata]